MIYIVLFLAIFFSLNFILSLFTVTFQLIVHHFTENKVKVNTYLSLGYSFIVAILWVWFYYLSH